MIDLDFKQKEVIDDFRGKAKAWKLITQDVNWENLALLCDKEMAKELVKTGECDWEDFEFCEFAEEEEEDEVCSTCHKQLEGDDKCSAGCPEYDAGCNQEDELCDFCDKPRKHLVKRDAGYDEHTCEECYKEQYPEEEDEEEEEVESADKSVEDACVAMISNAIGEMLVKK
jgi:hypothetical protein